MQSPDIKILTYRIAPVNKKLYNKKIICYLKRMREIIDALEKKFGCITKVAAHYGVSYQTLNNWRANTSNIKRLIEFYERAKKDLKIK
jgi:hypothetical protein